MKKFLSSAVAVAVLFGAGSAAAQVRQHQIALPDGSVAVMVTSREGGWFRSQESQTMQFHCNPTCNLVGNTSSSAPGALPGIVQSLIGGFSLVRAYEGLRPDETTIDNSSRSDSWSESDADARADAESWSDSYSRTDVDVNTDVNVDVRAASPTTPTPPTPCCTPPFPPPPPPPPPPPFPAPNN